MIVPDSMIEKENSLLGRLRASLGQDETLLVGYSGGVDSAYLAWAAHIVLGERMLAVIADSPSLPRKELASAVAFAKDHGIPYEVVVTKELDSPSYTRNDALRCFHCKDELFRVMTAFAATRNAIKIAYGRNMDDHGEFRPGHIAAEQYLVLAPLVEAGLGKDDIRTLARRAGLSVWSKPASACLASRVEYKREISPEVLAQIESAEDFLHSIGFQQVRVRHYGTIARIEIERSELPKALSVASLDTITAGVKAAGFQYVTLDTTGYRSGSMNEVIPVETLLQQT